MLIVLGILLVAVAVWLMVDSRTMPWQEKVNKLKRLSELGIAGWAIVCFLFGLLFIGIGVHISYRAAQRESIVENQRLTEQQRTLENQIAKLQRDIVVLKAQGKEGVQPAKDLAVEQKPVVEEPVAKPPPPSPPVPTRSEEFGYKPDKVGAWVMAESFVKDRLKAPGTASFGSVWRDYQSPDDCVTYLGKKRYKVTGWVDAENAFGAKIRSNFFCIVRDEGDTWHLEDINIASR